MKLLLLETCTRLLQKYEGEEGKRSTYNCFENSTYAGEEFRSITKSPTKKPDVQIGAHVNKKCIKPHSIVMCDEILVPAFFHELS